MKNHRVTVLARDEVSTFRSMLVKFGEAFADVRTYTRAQPDYACIRLGVREDVLHFDIDPGKRPETETP